MGAKASKAKASNDAYCAVPVLDVQELVIYLREFFCGNQLDLSEEIESSMDYGGDVNQKDVIEAKVSILNMESRNSRDVRLDGCSHDEYEAKLIYYEAKALKDKNQYQEAAKKFHFLIDMDQSHSTDSTTTMKFKSLKQMMKMKIKQGEYHQAAILFGHLLDFISSNCLWKSDYTISSVEKMLDRIFSLAPSHQADLDEKERLLAFTKIVYDEAINVFYPFKQRRECWSNENLWLHVYVKYSHFLFRLEEEQGLNELVQKLEYLREDATSVLITAYRLPSGLLVDFIELLLFRLQNDETLFIKSYQQKKIALGCMLSNYMCEMGSIHQYAAEIYLTSSFYDKAYSALLCACRCWKLANDSLAHVHSVKLLYVVKMLQGSSSGPQEIILEDIRPSDSFPTLVKIFNAFQKNDIENVEKHIADIDEKSVEKKYLAKVRLSLQKKILLNELPETSKVQLSLLSKKLNFLPYSAIIDLINTMKAEKKLEGQVQDNAYVGSQFRPLQRRNAINTAAYSYGMSTYPSNQAPTLQNPFLPHPPSSSASALLFSNAILTNHLTMTSEIPSLGQGINGPRFVAEDNHIYKNLLAKNSNTSESTAVPSPYELLKWSNPDGDFTVDIASSLAAGIVNIIQEAHEKYPTFAEHVDITSFEFDELGKQLIRLLHQRVEFQARNVCSFIDTGVHYTKQLYAASIRSTGLRCSVSGRFGPGIYTGNNCKAFAGRYGNVGLILLRLQGKTGTIMLDRFRRMSDSHQNIDTVIGNARTRYRNPYSTPQAEGFYQEVVLQSTSQCVPVIIFDAPLGNADGERCVKYLQEGLQNMVDAFLNVGSTPAGPGDVIQHSPEAFGQRMLKRQRRLYHGRQQHLFQYNAPEHLADIDDKAIMNFPKCKYDYKHECPICLDELGSNPNVLRFLPCACVHIFHHDCIHKSLAASPRCPTCQSWVREPQGKSPSGTMRVTIIPDNCSGYLEDTIAIHYLIRGAFQKSYHPSPNTPHSGKTAIAYLPNNDDGKKLLKRLKYAFEHGLTFTVGTSMTTGRDNQCTWASIHHKTSLSGGTERHGYPDASFLLNCNEELDGKGVPPADDLPNDMF